MIPGARRRGSRLLLAFIAVLFAFALIAALVSRRRGEGAVPGNSPVLSLAAANKGFLAGTSEGMWVTPDGTDWVLHPEFGAGRVVVAADSGVAYASSSRLVARIETSRTVAPLGPPPALLSSIAVTDAGDLYLATGGGRIFRLTSAGISKTAGRGAPPEVVAIDEAEGVLYAGGLVSGLYRSEDQGESWKQILKTSLTAIVVDPDDSQRILIGTAGGVLITEDSGEAWRFTEMRSTISGLSARGGEFFALGDRFLLRSADGDRDWSRVARK